MACHPENILLYIEGDLGPDEAAAVRAHTAACSACRDLLLSEQALESALGGLRYLEPPKDFTSATVRRAECDVAACVTSPRERRRAAAISAGLAVVAVILLWPTGVYGSAAQSMAPARCVASMAATWVTNTGLSVFIVCRTLSRSLLGESSLPIGVFVLLLLGLLGLLAWLISGYRRFSDLEPPDSGQ